MSDTNPQEIIEEEVKELLSLEAEVKQAEEALMQIPEFAKFAKLQKDFADKSKIYWAGIESAMINNDIKSIKGDWGSITVAERLGWKTTDELPAKFYKKVPDTKLLSDTFKLTNKVPKGAEPVYTKFLTKRFK